MTTLKSPGVAVRVVGVRETLSGDGAVRRHLTVYCEDAGRSVDAIACADCAHCVGNEGPTVNRPGAVHCLRLDVERASAPRGSGPSLPVWSVMQRDVVCVTADVAPATVTALLRAWGADGVPVVDESGRPVGMVSRTDLLGRPLHRGELANPAAHPPVPRTVAEVMTPRALSVIETTALAAAVASMSAAGFHQLPVVLADGTIVGVLSTRAVVRRVR